MTFLDVKKRKWIIGNLELPVKENIPMSETRWFRNTLAEKSKLLEEGKLTDAQIAQFEHEWDIKVIEIILGTTIEELENSGISDAEFREVLAEAFTFLKAFGTIEKAKQSGIYDQQISEPENKQ